MVGNQQPALENRVPSNLAGSPCAWLAIHPVDVAGTQKPAADKREKAGAVYPVGTR